MRPSVSEVDQHSHDKPDNQSQPGAAGQARHQGERDAHSQDWCERNEGSFERTRQIGTLDAQRPYSRGDDHEGEKRSDGGELAEYVDGQHTSDDGDKESNDNGGNPGS